MKYLGIDYGEKRVGLAVSDGLGLMAFPKKTITYTSEKQCFSELLLCIDEEGVERIVVGMPFYEDGTQSKTGEKVLKFLGKLIRYTHIPIYLINEYLTTFEASSTLAGNKKYKKSKKGIVDQQAAVIILNSLLYIPEHERVYYAKVL
ncbi:MAG: Holliday junction resolvase RuvX [Desulfovibrionaceae bacterium]